MEVSVNPLTKESFHKLVEVSVNLLAKVSFNNMWKYIYVTHLRCLSIHQVSICYFTCQSISQLKNWRCLSIHLPEEVSVNSLAEVYFNSKIVKVFVNSLGKVSVNSLVKVSVWKGQLFSAPGCLTRRVCQHVRSGRQLEPSQQAFHIKLNLTKLRTKLFSISIRASLFRSAFQ